MKKIKKLFIAITMIIASSLTAQSFDVEGFLLSTPQQVFPIIFTYDYDDLTVITDTVYTNLSDGYFSETFNTMLTEGTISMSYTNCNGDELYFEQEYNVFIGSDFGYHLYCPSTYNYDAEFVIQFYDFSSTVYFELSLDNGITFTSHTTDATGAFIVTIVGAPIYGSAIIKYLDCYDNLIEHEYTYSFIEQNTCYVDFCPLIKTYILFNNNDGVPVSFNISYDGGGSFSTETTNSLGEYFDPFSPTSSLIINFIDCYGNNIIDSANLVPAINALFLDLDYCPIECMADFGLGQDIIFDTTSLNIISTGNIMIMNFSIGTGLTYTWDFGDGSPSYTGVNFTHTYTSAGTYNLCLTVDNGIGCTDNICELLVLDSNGVLSGKTNIGFVLQMGTGEFETEVSINELEKDIEINIYPNPTTNFINIALNSTIRENSTLAIYDLIGNVVFIKNIPIVKGNQITKVEFNDLKKGMYIAQLKTNKGTLSTKLTIK